MIKKLTKIPTGQAKVIIFDDGGISLISYETSVVHISANKFLTVYGLYSATTRKHISAFMAEYAAPLNYYDAKKAYEGKYSINIETGEVLMH